MDDLGTDLNDYFRVAVKPVDIVDIVESDYVIGVVPNAADRRRSGWQWRVLVGSVVAILLVWNLIGLTRGGSQQIGNPSSPEVTTESDSTRPESSIGRSANLFDFTYTFPALGNNWELFGGFRLQKSATGPQGAEGIVYWVAYPNSKNASNCALAADIYSQTPLDNLARGVVRTPGLRLLSGPEDLLVGGKPARYSSLEITADNGCDPGYFYSWKANDGGALWYKYPAGGVVDVWVVDVDDGQSSLLVIVGLTDPEFPTLRDEIQEFVSSIVFPTE